MGEILDFQTSDVFDYVAGEAAPAYGGKLKKFTRQILFAKPDVVVIFDTVVAHESSIFQYYLHAETEMDIEGQTLKIATGDAGCVVSLLRPENLKISQTDQFDPPPRERVQLREYHVTAETTIPQEEATFIAVLRPHRTGDVPEGDPVLMDDGTLMVPLPNGELKVWVGRHCARRKEIRTVLWWQRQVESDSTGGVRSSTTVCGYWKAMGQRAEIAAMCGILLMG